MRCSRMKRRIDTRWWRTRIRETSNSDTGRAVPFCPKNLTQPFFAAHPLLRRIECAKRQQKGLGRGRGGRKGAVEGLDELVSISSGAVVFICPRGTRVARFTKKRREISVIRTENRCSVDRRTAGDADRTVLLPSGRLCSCEERLDERAARSCRHVSSIMPDHQRQFLIPTTLWRRQTFPQQFTTHDAATRAVL